MDKRLLTSHYNTLKPFKEIISKELIGADFGLNKKEGDSTSAKASKSLINQPMLNTIRFQCKQFLTPSNLSARLETSDILYLFFFRENPSSPNTTKIVMYQFFKQDGRSQSVPLVGVQSLITSAKAAFCSKIFPKLDKKGNILKGVNSWNVSPELVLIMGSNQGALLILEFQSLQEAKQLRTRDIKLGSSPIQQICQVDPDNFWGAKICLALSNLNQVSLVNYEIGSVLAIYQPTIMTCDRALSISVDEQNKYFMQTTKGGYIIHWQISQKVMNLVKLSNQIALQRNKLKVLNGLHLAQQNQHLNQNQQDLLKRQQNQSISPKQLDKQLLRYCIPLSILHGASIKGLLWAELFGDMVALITAEGVFKIIAISNEKLSDSQFLLILQFKIKDGSLIRDIRFYPQNEEIFILKGTDNENDKILIDDEGHYQNDSNQNQNEKIKQGNNNPFEKRQKSHQHISHLPKHIIESFQRICYDIEKGITSIDSVHPTTFIGKDGYESLDISEDKDIILLRAKDSFQIGACTLFTKKTSEKNH